jgi:hypothetical protein
MMRMGDLLIAAKLVTAEHVEQALEHQVEHGGRLGENLVAIGAIEQEALDAFLHRLPAEPADIAATGIPEADLLNLMMKVIYTGRLESLRQFVDGIKLPHHIVLELVRMATERHLLRALGAHDATTLTDMHYAVTDEGRRWAQDALQQSQYAGPAPVTIEAFSDRVHLQKVTNELVTFERIRKAFGDLTIADSFIEKIGPALNSGRAMLLYGPPGNGKTSVALSFASVFNDVIYMPYAVMVEGQIMRVYDPSFHVLPGAAPARHENSLAVVRREEYDARWIPCRRPFVVTGGELTLEMLDLSYDATANFYEAPLHMKALGGCFIVDDFGRQLVSPTSLLNRWIVPLESRLDYLKLHTGKSFSIPFEELVIFSTNLEPEDLMDPAFLRRLPYKLEVGAPDREQFKRIFETVNEHQSLTLADDVFESIVAKITRGKGLDLAAFHPKFIVDQVVATCRFVGKPPHFEPRFIDYAIDNLRVRRSAPAKAAGADRAGPPAAG